LALSRTLRARDNGAADYHLLAARREAPHNRADEPDFARPKLHFVRARRLSAAPLGALVNSNQHQHVQDKRVVELIDDAVFFADMAGKNLSSAVLPWRYGRSSIFTSALLLEAVANCLIADIEGKFRDEADRLPVIAKFDLYARLNSKLLDRGRIEVQRISELIKLRDQFVHPKVKAKPFNDLCRDGQGNFVGTPVSELFDGLKIEKGGPWSKEDAVTVLKAVFAFLNYYFIDLICFSHKKVFSLLVAAFEDIDDQEVSLEPAFHEWKNFLSEWNIPWRFLNDSRP
jgi:hypothetical protein